MNRRHTRRNDVILYAVAVAVWFAAMAILGSPVTL